MFLKLHLGLILLLPCAIQNWSDDTIVQKFNENLYKVPQYYKRTISMILTRNHISHITAEDVEGYQELEDLKIDENEIKNTDDIQGIKHLPALKTIDLSNNLMRAFDFRIFRHNQILKTIILDHNHKIHFNNNTVTLLALTKLSIKYSNLDDSFPWGILDGFTNLKILDLKYNNITTIPKHIFDLLNSKSVKLLKDHVVKIGEEVTKEQKGVEKEIKKEENMENNTEQNSEEDKPSNRTNSQDNVDEEHTVKENSLEADFRKTGNTDGIITGKNRKEENPDSKDNKENPINSTLKPFPKPDGKNRENGKDISSLLGPILISAIVICILVLTVILSLYFYSKCRRRSYQSIPNSNSEALLNSSNV